MAIRAVEKRRTANQSRLYEEIARPVDCLKTLN
jgi:hypothetical protein